MKKKVFYVSPVCKDIELKGRQSVCTAASLYGYSGLDDSVPGSEDIEEGDAEGWFIY